jgi:hypothetical protein
MAFDILPFPQDLGEDDPHRSILIPRKPFDDRQKELRKRNKEFNKKFTKPMMAEIAKRMNEDIVKILEKLDKEEKEKEKQVSENKHAPVGEGTILRYGWICPRCRKVHAPTVLSCTCLGAFTTPVQSDHYAAREPKNDNSEKA